jgi:O-antigen/teichoic acid export membrane protein
MLIALRSRLNILKNHRGLRRYAANTSWMMGEQILRIIAGLFIGIWVARFLGPEQFGLFSYVLAFTAIFGGIAKLGLDGILVRELVNHPELRDKYLGTAFWLKFIGALLVMALIAIILPFISNDATTNLFIFIIATGLVFQSFEVVEFYFQSQVLAKIISICKFIQLALSSIIKIYLVLVQVDLIWFVLVAAFDTISLSVSYFLAYKIRESVSFFKYFDNVLAKNLLKDSWPLIVTGVSVVLFMQTDKIMIKHMVGAYEAGLYTAGIKFPSAFSFLPMLLATSLFPAILNSKITSLGLYKERLQKFYFLMTWLGIALVAFFYASSEFLIGLYGENFSSAKTVMLIYSISLIFLFQWIARGRWVLAENLQYLTFYYMAFGAFINVFLNLFLINRMGISGAAVATVLTQFLITLVIPLFFKKMRASTLMIFRSYITWRVR